MMGDWQLSYGFDVREIRSMFGWLQATSQIPGQFRTLHGIEQNTSLSLFFPDSHAACLLSHFPETLIYVQKLFMLQIIQSFIKKCRFIY